MGRGISQHELDQEGFERGRKRYYKSVKRAMDAGAESSTNWGSRMVESAILPMSLRLKEVMETDKGVGAVLLRELDMDPKVMAMLAFQSLLDGSAKGKTFTRGCSKLPGSSSMRRWRPCSRR